MDAIKSDPATTFNDPPNQPCPECRGLGVINHRPLGEPNVEPVETQGTQTRVRLFGLRPATQATPEAPRTPVPQADTPAPAVEAATQATPHPDAALIASGDLFVPEPVLVNETGLMKDNKAKPHQQVVQHLPGHKPPPAPAIDPQPAKRINADFSELDDVRIGGKFTIFVLLYGEYIELHRRCLNSIIETVPAARMDLRVAANQVCAETKAYLAKLPITKIYYDEGSRRKYPAMREMFWDDTCPIETKFVIWFDDDSYALQPTWIRSLAHTIINQPPESRVGMYGCKMVNPCPRIGGKPQTQWFEQARWWRGRPLVTRRGITAPNGHYLPFCVGGFWCMSVEALRECDIPDPRLVHNGGDCLNGLALYQNGFNFKSFNESKEFVKTSGAPRRGYSEKFPWH